MRAAAVNRPPGGHQDGPERGAPRISRPTQPRGRNHTTSRAATPLSDLGETTALAGVQVTRTTRTDLMYAEGAEPENPPPTMAGQASTTDWAAAGETTYCAAHWHSCRTGPATGREPSGRLGTAPPPPG